ncbi:MAG TPA: DUF1287 domain-containing protein [Flavobacterium sp.]|jgi:hypothetical protein
MKFLFTLLFLVGFSVDVEKTFAEKLSDAAILLTYEAVQYDPTYYSIKYPYGDVPKGKGVCTDVVIRAYRKLGIDLQKEVHVDMKANFAKYPKIWGLRKPDTNIDHRRVPNLQVFFTRFGKSLGVSEKASDFQTGDLITWMIGGKLPHIGIVTSRRSKDGTRNLIVHNVGGGQVLADCLFSYRITGHYRYQQ